MAAEPKIRVDVRKNPESRIGLMMEDASGRMVCRQMPIAEVDELVSILLEATMRARIFEVANPVDMERLPWRSYDVIGGIK